MKAAINRILVRPINPPPATIAGVEVVTKDPQVEGEILAIGVGPVIASMGLKVGMKAIYGQYAGEDITVDGEKCKVLFVDETIESELLGYDDNC